MPFLGPAFIAAVAYVDLGNFAINISGGAQFGYLLLWVILTSNLMAMLIQSMSAKLGIATGKNLPEVCRAPFPRAVTSGLRSAHDSDSLLYAPNVVEEAFSEVPTILILFSSWSHPAHYIPLLVVLVIRNQPETQPDREVSHVEDAGTERIEVSRPGSG